jgi:hypothetical protein
MENKKVILILKILVIIISTIHGNGNIEIILMNLVLFDINVAVSEYLFE